jgi:hypothetical protein
MVSALFVFPRLAAVSLPKPPRKKAAPSRSWSMAIIKKLRMVFYVLATVELLLLSLVGGRLPF